ncbi:MAG: glycoside hydrolase family 2 TIM barrel-domain containing protein [Bacteroidales bacterium]|nr:glycoside hydrolase family 2 TIM barrel-domain containing protein [Bacteroidales bacterium]
MRLLQKCFFILWCFCSLSSYAQRNVISLNGKWQIEESVSDKQPKRYTHSITVPGLVITAEPSFRDADNYKSKQYLENSFVVDKQGKTPGIDTVLRGINYQPRNYYWYKKDFTLSSLSEICLLRINKGQFGIEAWINGKKAGDYLGCFSATIFDISDFVKKGKNSIVIKVGAHPNTLPEEVCFGTDFEKIRWQAGLYDDVSIIQAQSPYIESIQIAPDIHKSEVVVQSVIINKKKEALKSPLTHSVKEWKSQKEVASHKSDIYVEGGKSIVETSRIHLPDAQLWSPENPFLYTVTTSTNGDLVTTRFGMREFRFDGRTKRAYLNDSLIYLRGSNITLHRFFDDSRCGDKPWNEAWVRKLIGETAKKFQWNSFRFCIGPVPQMWFDIADEYGLLIQNEYFIWNYKPYWSKELLESHIKDWMRDSWNHPSVAWWDINNETYEPKDKPLTSIIRNVRGCDLSNRAWDNGYNLPDQLNDPVEDHNYNNYAVPYPFPYEQGVGQKTTNSPHPTPNAVILNEYGWLWVHRNGVPTELTKAAYKNLVPDGDPEKVLETSAYMFGAETEYFRAHRNYAGILQFTLLTCTDSDGLTSDIIQDYETLDLIPCFEKYYKEAFKPVGVYLNYWHKATPGANEKVDVMMVNDLNSPVKGSLTLQLEDSDGNVLYSQSEPFSLDAIGQNTSRIYFDFPEREGEFILKAIARYNGETTTSLRKINLSK